MIAGSLSACSDSILERVRRAAVEFMRVVVVVIEHRRMRRLCAWVVLSLASVARRRRDLARRQLSAFGLGDQEFELALVSPWLIAHLMRCASEG